MIDLDRITHPLRLAKGSHQEGSGKGCAMNVISYINGDTQITDYPDCSARPLAVMVQNLNDSLAGPDGFLSPENSVLVLDLGWATVGTSGASEEVVWQWLVDILVDPDWGVIQYAQPDDVLTIRYVADLCARQARGDSVSKGEWNTATDAACAAAYTAVAVGAANASSTATYAASAAAAATAGPGGAALAAHYAYAPSASDRGGFIRWAINRWRELMGLDNQEVIDVGELNSALERVNA